MRATSTTTCAMAMVLYTSKMEDTTRENGKTIRCTASENSTTRMEA